MLNRVLQLVKEHRLNDFTEDLRLLVNRAPNIARQQILRAQLRERAEARVACVLLNRPLPLRFINAFPRETDEDSETGKIHLTMSNKTPLST